MSMKVSFAGCASGSRCGGIVLPCICVTAVKKSLTAIYDISLKDAAIDHVYT